MVSTKDIDWLESVDFSGLSNRGMMLCSRFARELKKADGSVLRLRDPQLPMFISRTVRTKPTPILVSIFQDLIAELEVLAEKRGQPRYRGSLTDNNATPKTSASNDQADQQRSEAPKMYRGVLVEPKARPLDRPEKTSQKNGVYRGSEIKQ